MIPCIAFNLGMFVMNLRYYRRFGFHHNAIAACAAAVGAGFCIGFPLGSVLA